MITNSSEKQPFRKSEQKLLQWNMAKLILCLRVLYFLSWTANHCYFLSITMHFTVWLHLDHDSEGKVPFFQAKHRLYPRAVSC